LKQISIRRGQAMAETLILSLSATNSLRQLGLRSIDRLVIASNSQLWELNLDPLGSMGLECMPRAGFKYLP